jgi:hypothetical protein
MSRTVAGLFPSPVQAGWARRDLKESGFQDVDLDEQRTPSGESLLTVQAGSRETEAIRIMARHGAEWMQKQEGQQIGDISNAPREGDNAPVITEPLDSPDALRKSVAPGATPEEQSSFERANLAQSTGQYYDMTRSRSDDGTVPPSAIREAITTPPTAEYDQTMPGARKSTSGAPEAPQGIPPADTPRQPETPLQEFAARPSSESEPAPNGADVAQARKMIESPVSPPPGPPQVQDRGND